MVVAGQWSGIGAIEAVQDAIDVIQIRGEEIAYLIDVCLERGQTIRRLERQLRRKNKKSARQHRELSKIMYVRWLQKLQL